MFSSPGDPAFRFQSPGTLISCQKQEPSVSKNVCAGVCVCVCVCVYVCVPSFQGFDLPASLYQLKLLKAWISYGGNGEK